eukprot:gene2943-3228_t
MPTSVLVNQAKCNRLMADCIVLCPLLSSKPATQERPATAKVAKLKAAVQLATAQVQLQRPQPPNSQQPTSQQQTMLRRVNTVLPDDIVTDIMRLVHHMALSEVLHSLRQVSSHRAGRMYKVKREVLLNMDDDDPDILQAREEVLYFWAVANGLDSSNCWQLAQLWPDDLEILHCLPDLV